MNFSFLFILLLLVLGFTYKTLNISKKMLALIILILIILVVSYNIKENFQETTDETTDENQNIVEDEAVKNSYLLVNDNIAEQINQFQNMDLHRDNKNNKNLRAEILSRLRQIK